MYYVFYRWSGKGLLFSGISRGYVIGYRSRLDSMCNEEVQTYIFMLSIKTSITMFYKLITHYFFSSIGCLTEGMSQFCQNMHSKILKYGVFVFL